MPVAMKVSSIDRPGLFEQFWRMGLSQNLEEWEEAMRMQQLPIFNTCYADKDGHIMSATTMCLTCVCLSALLVDQFSKPLLLFATLDNCAWYRYVYNANVPVHPTGNYEFWQGVVPVRKLLVHQQV